MKLPPKVHAKGRSLYYVDKNKWHRLCAVGSPEHIIHGEIWKLLRARTDTLAKVMDDFAAVKLPRLASATQADYIRIIEACLKPIFGPMNPDDLTCQDVAVYLELREQQGRASMGNKEIAVLSSVIEHGLRIRACSFNPCRGVRRNKVSKRTYYITDESLRTALRSASAPLRHLMWAAYLTGFRQKDLRELTRANLTPDGIKVIQSKDGKHELRLWSESLRKVVRRALQRSRCAQVFTNEKGEPLSRDAIKSAMYRLKRDHGIAWHFHDIRAKADSDHETGLGLMRRYNRAKRLRAVK